MEERGAKVGSSTFSGNFSHTIDPKWRVTIPVSYRDKLGKKFTISMNQQFNAIAIYPADVWGEYIERFKKVKVLDNKAMRYVNLLNANAFPDCDIDLQGRILLPPNLRQLAHLDKAIRFVGAVDVLEIWDESLYAQYMLDSMNDKDDIIEHFNAAYYT